jgi:hypothetical protein
MIIIHSGNPNYRLHCFEIRQRKIPNDNTSFEALQEIYNAYKARDNASSRVVLYYKKQFADGMLLCLSGELSRWWAARQGAQNKQIAISCS